MKKRPGLAQNKMILWLFRFFFNFGPCLFISSKWKFRPKKYRSTIEKNFFNFSIFDAGGASIPRTRLSSRLTSFFHAARRRRRRVGVRSVIARLLISLFIKKWASSWLFYSFLKNGPTRPLFCLFSFFSITILQKNCRPQQIRTRIVGVEGEHADHLTTTTAQGSFIVYFRSFHYPITNIV